MDYNKFFLQSKTIIGAVLIALSMVAPLLGIEFSAEEATTFVDKIGVFFDRFAEVIGLALVVWGRFTAAGPLSVLPVKKNDTLQSSWMIGGILFGVMLLSACTQTSLVSLNPATRLYQVEANFAIAKEEAALYAARPFCSETIIVACADPEVVVKLDDASDKTEVLIEQARLYVTALQLGNPNPPNSGALGQASASLRALIAILATIETSKGA